MSWSVEFNVDFKKEYDQFHVAVKEELVAKALALSDLGQILGDRM